MADASDFAFPVAPDCTHLRLPRDTLAYRNPTHTTGLHYNGGQPHRPVAPLKKAVITIVKVAVVVGLFAYVLSNIQWRDALTYLDPVTGNADRVLIGSIHGNWDGRVVTFQPAGSPDLETVDREVEHVTVSPGLLTYFKNLDRLYFSLAVVLTLLSIFFSAVRWWWLMGANNLNVSLSDSIRYTWLGLFFNNIIPGQTGGDVVKAIYIARRCSGDRVRAFLSVFVDRVLGLTSLALLAAIVVSFNTDRFMEIAIVIWGVLAAGILVASAFFSRRLRQRLGLKHVMLRLPQKVQHLLKEVDAAIFHYRSHKTGIFVWLLLGIVNHIVAVSGVVMFGESVGVGIPPHEYFVLVPVIVIVSAVPIAPNGWGVGEALYAKLFGEYGAFYLSGTPDAELVMSTRGIAVSILYRIVFTALSLLGGLVLLFEKQRLTKREIQQQAGF